MRALKGTWSDKPKEKYRVEELIHLFQLDGKKLLYNRKICVPRKAIPKVLQVAHDSKTAGHFKFAKTMSRLTNFHWRHKSRDVRNYINGCLKCQQYKDSNQQKMTDPTSLEMPERRWGSLATDFVVHLPKTKEGYDAITTWVDRLTRRVHFIKSRTTDTAVDCANSFFSNIFKHHGLPDSIVSDRDSKLTSAFWKRLMELSGVQLKMSSSRHPQTDGSSEIMNRMIENYLRCYCNYHQDNWDELLASAEFAYNSSVSEDVGTSPFELDLGWKPKDALDFIHSCENSIQSVSDLKDKLKSSLEDAQFSYKVSKARQSSEASGKYKKPDYKVGSKVWINKTLFSGAYSKSQTSQKLSSKRVGPFVVKELIGKNALRLELPEHFKIHPVVHVIHTLPYVEKLEDLRKESFERPEPVPKVEGDTYIVQKILEHKKVGKGYRFLVLWEVYPEHDATWQKTKDFMVGNNVNAVWKEYIREHGILPQHQ